MSQSVRLFNPDQEALFVSRPNRFLMLARPRSEGSSTSSADQQVHHRNGLVPCHCPNPGRMLEFCLPGAELFLEKRQVVPVPGSPAPKTLWTAAALRYHGSVVCLAPVRMNKAAQALVFPWMFPEARQIVPEFFIGSFRFDFMVVDRDGMRHLVEVKSCSLVEHEVAMFPDAPSLRASRHLDELVLLAGQGYHCHVLFMIAHGHPQRLVPNLHTDPAFAVALSRAAAAIDVRAAEIHLGENGLATLARDEVPVDLSYGSLAGQDRGSYLITLQLAEPATVAVGALGPIEFEAGWYAYAGSAQRGLSSRMARHLRKTRKTRHWHLDYLTPHASGLESWPVASERNLECELAKALRSIGGREVPGFGSSDCGCSSHLFRLGSAPRSDPAFIGLILRFRHVLALFPVLP
ncbi:MAG: DNA/RNA nuclease SfsA [Spirochaetia bacterium]|jgi:sugar fermentation stimulation protein A|nr:DNA/RNA nuclease SfsA [Spirochaetia bacterium]